MPTALDGLVAAARALPAPPLAGTAEEGPPTLPRNAERLHPVQLGDGTPAPEMAPAELRARTRALLDELALRVDAQLPRVLELAATAWDQVDTLVVFDAGLRGEAVALRRAAAALEASADAPAAARAIGLEARLLLDSSLGLVSLLERRLATLIRLRMRSDADAPLTPGGRPFLDIGAALREAARSMR